MEGKTCQTLIGQKGKVLETVIGIKKFIFMVEKFIKQLEPYFQLHRHLLLLYFLFTSHSIFPHLPSSVEKSPKSLYIFKLSYLTVILVSVQSQIQKRYLLFKSREFHTRNRVNTYGAMKRQKEDTDITQKQKLQETDTILWSKGKRLLNPRSLEQGF